MRVRHAFQLQLCLNLGWETRTVRTRGGALSRTEDPPKPGDHLPLSSGHPVCPDGSHCVLGGGALSCPEDPSPDQGTTPNQGTTHQGTTAQLSCGHLVSGWRSLPVLGGAFLTRGHPPDQRTTAPPGDHPPITTSGPLPTVLWTPAVQMGVVACSGGGAFPPGGPPPPRLGDHPPPPGNHHPLFSGHLMSGWESLAVLGRGAFPPPRSWGICTDPRAHLSIGVSTPGTPSSPDPQLMV